jgi:hypothetical protein
MDLGKSMSWCFQKLSYFLFDILDLENNKIRNKEHKIRKF